jgi:PLAT/LH2 domain
LCNTANPNCTGGGGTTGTGASTKPSVSSVTISNRTATSFSLLWSLPTNATSWSLKQSANGTTTQLYGRSGSGGITSLALSALTPDTQYCFILTATNTHGSSSSTNCEWSQDGKSSTLYRVQLQITTGTTSGAGTDDVIDAELGGFGNGTAAGGTTQLDLPGDDFQAGSTQTYDLVNMGDISELGDIHSVVLYKHGNDDWCVSNIVLIVDGVAVSSADFGPPCATIGNEGAVGVTSAQLRADPRWAAFKVPPLTVVNNADGTVSATLQIPRLEIEQRIASETGDSIQGTDLYWGDDGEAQVSPYTTGEDAVHMHLSADEFGPDPGVDIDFKLMATTSQDATTKLWSLNLTRSAVTVNVDLDLFEEVLDTVIPCGPVVSVATGDGIPFCLQYLAQQGADQIEAQVAGTASSIGISALPSNLTATFDASGNLDITATLGTPKQMVVVHPPVATLGGAINTTAMTSTTTRPPMVASPTMSRSVMVQP